MNKCFVLWEFSGKQDYVFRSSKLKENIGASLIMKSLSEDFLSTFNEYYHNKDIVLEERNFIIKGGGKSLYVFRDNLPKEDLEKRAEEFIKVFSYMVLKEYPGLELFIVKKSYDDSDEKNIKNVIDELYDKLESKKTQRRNLSYQLGFGIEQKCTSTGNAASSYYIEDDKRKYISTEINSKRKCLDDKGEFNDYGNELQKKFIELLPINDKGTRYNLLTSINNIIKDGAKSYIAIVHIDGNRMGEKFKKFKNSIKKLDSESYIEEMRKFSENITKVNEDAFKYMAEIIHKNRKRLSDYTNIEKNEFPLRPLILAGDDITYITSAVIGIETAKLFIEYLNEVNIHACAGVAIVKNTYPYIKGYNLAEELCQNAKNFLLEENLECSALDFHISQGDINSSIMEIRENDYKTHNYEGENPNLTMKPILISKNSEPFYKPNIQWRNYDNLIAAYDNIVKSIDDNKIGKSKISQLKEIFKQGTNATEYFLKFYNLNDDKLLKPLNNTSAFSKAGFNSDNKCMYLDAIEMLDLFVKLDK